MRDRQTNCFSPRGRWYSATAAVSLAIWLLLTVAEAYPALHAWLHGGTIPDNDDCAIVALVHGSVETAAPHVPVLLPVTGLEIDLRFESPVVCSARVILPDSRGPPALFSVS